MAAAKITVTPANWSNPAERDACRAIREAVFVAEQKIPAQNEQDGLDPQCRHVLARDVQGRPVGTGRLVPPQGDTPARISRIAVTRMWRGLRVGEAILRALTGAARSLGFMTVEVHAAARVAPFYERYGFAAHGEEFAENGIAHRRLRLTMKPPVKPQATGANRPQPPPVSSAERLSSREEVIGAMVRVIQQARRSLAFYSHFDPPLLDDDAVCEAIKQLATSGPDVNIRLLVHDPKVMVRNSRTLLPLMQRLTTAITVRTPADQDRTFAGAFGINDMGGFVFRQRATRYEGEAAESSPGRNARLLDFFNPIWERSEPCTELRQWRV